MLCASCNHSIRQSAILNWNDCPARLHNPGVFGPNSPWALVDNTVILVWIDQRSYSFVSPTSTSSTTSPMDTRNTPHRRQQTQYLIGYNLVCAVLWFAILVRVLLLIPLVGFENVGGGVGEFAKWTQTLALLEVVHSAMGKTLSLSFPSFEEPITSGFNVPPKFDIHHLTDIVRSPLPTTLMQVSSRLLLIWAVVNRYPSATAPSPFYSSMLLAWSVTEVIRYSYFVWNLQGAGVPGFVVWLRYNTFYVLYPVGIVSECLLVWKASVVAERWVQVVFWGVLGVYVPGESMLAGGFGGGKGWANEGVGSYILFTHMMAQRRKVMRGKGVEGRG